MSLATQCQRFHAILAILAIPDVFYDVAAIWGPTLPVKKVTVRQALHQSGITSKAESSILLVQNPCEH